MEGIDGNGKKRREYSPTYLSLDWLAKRIRKSRKLKQKLAEGEYPEVNSEEVASSILNKDKK